MRPEGTQEDLPEDMEREIVPGARREPRGATVAELERYDVLIDARSPAEFEHDHIPGAINCPVLDDAERREIGTLYKQVSAFEARKLGAAMVARNIARHLDERFRGQPKGWRPLVYCWRGGMRSGSFVTWLRLVGWDAQQLQGAEQPSQKAFETQLADRIARFDLGRPVWVEAESRKIGRLSVPDALLLRLRASPLVEIAATPQARLDYLLRDYAELGDDPRRLRDQLALLHGLVPNEALEQWLSLIHI